MQYKRIAAVICALLFLIPTGCSRTSPQITQLYFLNWGYEDTRYTNLYQAIQEFNQKHPDRPYALHVEKYQDEDWDEYQTLCEQRHEEGKLDLFITGHEYIGTLSEQDIILPLNDLLEQDLFQQEYFSTVWSSVTYQEQYWGMPLDLDVQMVFVNRNALRAAGYSEEEIQNLPMQVASGNFLMDDLLEIARAGIQDGGCRFGVLHRPKNGQFFYMIAQSFGALTDGQDGTLDIHEDNYAEMLSFYQELRNENLLPQNIVSMSWFDVNQSVAEGEPAVYFGACYSLYDIVIDCNVVAEDVLAQYVPILFPAIHEDGRPLTISHPMVYVVDKDTKYRDDILEILSITFEDSHNLATHCATTYHLPASASALADAIFHNNTFLMDSIYMLDYTIFLPTDSDIRMQMDILFGDVIAAEQTNELPSEIAHAASRRFSEEN